MSNFNVKNKINEHDRILMEKAEILSRMSDDPRKKVGAIIGYPDGSIVAMGFNDLELGTKNREKILNNKELKNEIIVHAERNAIENASNALNSSAINLAVCSIYVSFAPCEECAKCIIQAGIRRVLFPRMDNSSSSWWKSAERAKKLMRNAGLEFVEVEMQSALQLKLCA